MGWLYMSHPWESVIILKLVKTPTIHECLLHKMFEELLWYFLWKYSLKDLIASNWCISFARFIVRWGTSNQKKSEKPDVEKSYFYWFSLVYKYKAQHLWFDFIKEKSNQPNICTPIYAGVMYDLDRIRHRLLLCLVFTTHFLWVMF